MSAPNPDHYAIVVGIDTYPKLQRLTGAVSDATRFMEWLLLPHGGGLDPNNIQPVLSTDTIPPDPLDAIPAQKQITAALRNLGVENNARIGKRLYFYFAGHGFGPVFDDVGMLLADAWEPSHLGSNIGLRPYRLFFRDHRLFDEVIFVLDCCRDDRGGVPTKGPDFTLQTNGAGPAFIDFVVLAAVYGEKAFQPVNAAGERRAGLLTEALLEGLNGAAADGLGRITYATLSEYVKARVPKLAKERSTVMQLAQLPEVDPPRGDAELVIATIPADKLQRVRVHIVARAGLPGDLVLCEGIDRREIGRRPAAQATAGNPWEVPLVRNRAYRIEHSDTGFSQPLDTSNVQAEPHVVQFPAI